MLLNDALRDFFALLWSKVSLGIKELGVPLLYLFDLLSFFHLHLHVLLVLQVLKLFHLLLDLKGLFLGSDLILELFLLDLLFHAKVLQLVLYTFLSVRLGQLVVLMEFFSLYFVMVVDCVRSLGAKEGWDLLIVTW